ncbi:PASTA domain-containing protein [Spirochaetia bacterium]|nr:PASTA domain-containing protein [Spirochaetia bacterium]
MKFEEYVSNHFRLFISLAAALVIFVGIIAVSVFFISVRGAEEVMVPDVRGKDLIAALMELQTRELYPRLDQRFSQSAEEKGLVLEQSPPAGTIVKAGRRIRLVVSQGVLINRVENYVGRNIDEVRLDLQALAAAAGNASPVAITLKEPFMYEFSPEPSGTILKQKPEPGAGISGPTALELVVSRGAEEAAVKMPALTDLPMAKALETIGAAGIAFTVTLQPVSGRQSPGIVLSQDPPAGTVLAADARIALTVTSPLNRLNAKGEVFSLFRYEMPRNPYPLTVLLEALLPAQGNTPGERRELFRSEHPGGELTVPYLLPEGSTLILSMLNREIYRETVTDLEPELSLDQL